MLLTKHCFAVTAGRSLRCRDIPHTAPCDVILAPFKKSFRSAWIRQSRRGFCRRWLPRLHDCLSDSLIDHFAARKSLAKRGVSGQCCTAIEHLFYSSLALACGEAEPDLFNEFRRRVGHVAFAALSAKFVVVQARSFFRQDHPVIQPRRTDMHKADKWFAGNGERLEIVAVRAL